MALRDDVAGLKSGQERLEGRQERLEIRQLGLEHQQGRLEERKGQLEKRRATFCITAPRLAVESLTLIIVRKTRRPNEPRLVDSDSRPNTASPTSSASRSASVPAVSRSSEV